MLITIMVKNDAKLGCGFCAGNGYLTYGFIENEKEEWVSIPCPKCHKSHTLELENLERKLNSEIANRLAGSFPCKFCQGGGCQYCDGIGLAQRTPTKEQEKEAGIITKRIVLQAILPPAEESKK